MKNEDDNSTKNRWQNTQELMFEIERGNGMNLSIGDQIIVKISRDKSLMGIGPRKR